MDFACKNGFEAILSLQDGIFLLNWLIWIDKN